MIVTDLSNSFNPYPKYGQKIDRKASKTNQKNKEEFCIMPKSTKYSTKRTEKYCERHEVFFGQAYRQKSINDGLVVFLTPESHRGTYGVHGKEGKEFNFNLKQIAQKTWQEYYNKTKEDFIQRYGKIDL